jgi:hypothetical protein
VETGGNKVWCRRARTSPLFHFVIDIDQGEQYADADQTVAYQPVLAENDPGYDEGKR